jgi:glycine/D-amino acid oxidase-like deaminating enzyme
LYPDYSMSPENRPLIDEIAPDSNVFVLGLFSGFGIMCASGASQLLTSIMLKKPLPSYAKAFSVGRYKDAEYLKNMHKIVSGKL